MIASVPEETAIHVNAASGRMTASVPEETTMDDYNTVTTFLATGFSGKWTCVNTWGLSDFLTADTQPRSAPADSAGNATPCVAGALMATTVAATGCQAWRSQMLSKQTYPFTKQVPWSSTEFLLTPGKANPINRAKAIGKVLDMGTTQREGKVT